jgi:hypothetical protein
LVSETISVVLEARGLIEQGYRGVAVRAPEALRAFVDEG